MNTFYILCSDAKYNNLTQPILVYLISVTYFYIDNQLMVLKSNNIIVSNKKIALWTCFMYQNYIWRKFKIPFF